MPPITWAQLQRHKPGHIYSRRPSVEAAYASAPKEPANILGRKQTVFGPNKYPYWTTADIYHWLLWSARPLSFAAVQKRLERDLPKTAEFIWFTNLPHLQSVSTVWHAHVFWRYPLTKAT